MNCPHCNYDSLQEGFRYCPNCGGGLPPAPQVVVSQDVGTVQEGARVVGVEIKNWITNVLSPSEEQAQARRQRERWDMLRRVESDWVKGMLEPSLQGLSMMTPGMEDRAEAVAVKRAWEDVVQMPGEGRRPLSQGATIVDAFERSNQSLLILGEPGAGKSIMLLELARQTLERARDDPMQPIPVVLHLASWAEEQRPVEEWLVQELRTRYDRPRQVARSWVGDDGLLLLLDGLDEVQAGAREACVRALNTFRAEHAVPIVVCCRVEEWQALDTRLKLGGAVLLQPLTPEQIDGYLERAGGELEALRLALQRDPDLRELAETPLTLSVMTRAYRGVSAEEMPALGTAEARRTQLFDRYIERMFEHGGAQQPYAPEQTVRWLGWLAGRMREHGQMILRLEGLQPSWLSSRRQRWLYILGSRVLTGLVMGLAVVVLRILTGLDPAAFYLYGVDPAELSTLLLPHTAAGLGVGLADAMRLERNRPGQGSSTPGILRGRRLAIYTLLITVTATIMWLVPSVTLGEIALDEPGVWASALLLAGLPFGLIWGLRLHGQSANTDIRTVDRLRWSWRGFLLPALALGLIPALITFTITSLLHEPGVRLWDGETGKQIKALEGHTDWVTSASFSPDGTQIVTTCRDDTARLWDGETGESIATLEGPWAVVWTASFSPDGTRVVTAGEDWLWDAETGASITPHKDRAEDVKLASFSRDGMQIVTIGRYNTAWLRDGQSGAPIVALEVPRWSNIYLVSFSPDGEQIVAASGDGTASLWDADSGAELRRLEGHTDGVRSAAFSPDGRTVVTASDDGTARLWDVDSGSELRRLEGHTDGVRSAAFSPGGRTVVTASDDGTARLWDGETGKHIKTLEGRSASFSPDGTRILTASADATARLWDGETGKHIKTLEGYSASFSPDGTRILTASRDNTARLWDGQTGTLLATLNGHRDRVSSASFSADGTQIVTAGGWRDDRPLALLALLPGILLGLLGGLRVPIQESVVSPEQARPGPVSPNRGIKRFAASAALAGFAAGLVSALLVMAYLPLYQAPSLSAAILALYAALGLVTGAAIVAGLASGGLDVLYHYLLRFILAITCQTPWRFVRFLDYAARRIFLRKPGGSYTFIHRLLRDHFAELYGEESGRMRSE